MIRSAILALTLGLAGCSPSADTPVRAPADVNVTIKPEPPAPAKAPDVTPELPDHPETPTAFEYPADLGGEAVASAVAPDRPTLTPDRTAPAPKPRTPPAGLLEPAVLTPRPSLKLPPPSPAASAVAARPVPPRERVPAEFGRGSEQVPARPTFRVAAGVTQRARDARLPPPMPTLGRPLAERVSLDDPTADLANAAVVGPPPRVPAAPAAFQKASVPDPFELGEQIRPKIPPSAEPGLAPVPVDPRRVK